LWAGKIGLIVGYLPRGRKNASPLLGRGAKILWVANFKKKLKKAVAGHPGTSEFGFP
jgi:hypothetical protein